MNILIETIKFIFYFLLASVIVTAAVVIILVGGAFISGFLAVGGILLLIGLVAVFIKDCFQN